MGDGSFQPGPGDIAVPTDSGVTLYQQTPTMGSMQLQGGISDQSLNGAVNDDFTNQDPNDPTAQCPLLTAIDPGQLIPQTPQPGTPPPSTPQQGMANDTQFNGQLQDPGAQPPGSNGGGGTPPPQNLQSGTPQPAPAPSQPAPAPPNAFKLGAQVNKKLPPPQKQPAPKLKADKATKDKPKTKKKIPKKGYIGKPDWDNRYKLNAELGTNIDFKKLGPLEGNQWLKGYAPDAGSSGVSTATGFDAGQRSKKGIKDMGLSDELTNKLLPYAGLKRDPKTGANPAKTQLEKIPLEISQDEANQIDQVTHREFAKSTRNSWNSSLPKGGTKFQDLTPEQQTVLFSRTFHQGPGMPNTPVARQFYKDAQAGKWEQAEQDLRNYGQKTVTKTVNGKKVTKTVNTLPGWYRNRVNREADLLQAEREAKAKDK